MSKEEGKREAVNVPRIKELDNEHRCELICSLMGWQDARTHLLEVTVEEIGVGKGYLGCILRLRLRWDGVESALPNSLIAKCPPLDSDIFEQFFLPLQLMQKELHFYTHLSPILSFVDDPRKAGKKDSKYGAIPHLYFGHYEEGKGVLMLQDIANGFTVPLNDGLSIDKLKVALRSIAEVHAIHWRTKVEGEAEREREQSLSWLHAGQEAEAFFSQLITGLTKEAMPKFRKVLELGLSGEEVDRICNECESLIPFIPVLQKQPSKKGHALSICHGDLWLNNILFLENSEEASAVLLDWQFACVDNPLIDIRFLFVSSLDPDLRKQQELEMLQVYYTYLQLQLGERGKDYSFEMCVQDYNTATGSTLIQLLSSIDVFMVGEGGEKLPSTSLVRRIATFFKDVDYQQLRNSCA